MQLAVQLGSAVYIIWKPSPRRNKGFRGLLTCQRALPEPGRQLALG